jgi:hypothetical protein
MELRNWGEKPIEINRCGASPTATTTALFVSNCTTPKHHVDQLKMKSLTFFANRYISHPNSI